MSDIKSKIVKTRDTATAVLRRLGIKPPAYNTFIELLPDNTWEVKMQKIYDQGYGIVPTPLAKPAPAKVEKPKAAKPPKAHKKVATKVVKTKTEKPARISCSSVARDLILAGKTNEEVWKVIKDQFKLSDDKRHYPTWYRCQLNRAKKISS
jgi:hypothetical protein